MRLWKTNLPEDPELRRVLIGLALLQFLVWTGGSAIVPLLPTYLHAKGASPAAIGIVMASFYAAGVVTQYPLGRKIDRIGPRVVIVTGLAIFALGSIGFAGLRGVSAAIVFRSLQGIGAGAVTVVGTTTVARMVQPGGQGGAFAFVYGSQMLGLSVGPLAGGLLGASSMRLLFFCSAILAISAMAPAFAAIPGRMENHVEEEGRARPRLRDSPALPGAIFVFLSVGALTGLYESCWSLLLHAHRASSPEIGLSWTLYCVIFVILSGPGGRIADRFDRRRLVLVGNASAAIFALIYPRIDSVFALVTLGSVEAIGAVVVIPAALSMLAESTPASIHGAAQGATGTAQTAAVAVSAASCGALFGLSHQVPFDATAAVMVLLALGSAWAWRHLSGQATVHNDKAAVRPEPAAHP